MSTAGFAPALSRCTGRARMRFLLILQAGRQIGNTRHQFLHVSFSSPKHGLEGTQKGEQVLLLGGREPLEVPDDLVGLAASTAVGFDGFHQIAGAAIMQEEEALADTPQGRGAKLLRTRPSLRDPVCEALPHAVQQKIGV